MRILHLATHVNTGGITTYIKRLIRPLKALGIETFVLTSGGERTEGFRTQGATVFELPLKTKSVIHPKLWLALPKLISILRTNHIDLIHAHTRVTQVLGAAASLLTGIPMVTTCHGFFKPKLGRTLFPCWGKKVIAISSMVRDHLINDFKVPSARVSLIYNAVNIAELETAYRAKDGRSIKQRYGFSPDDPVVGIIARIVNDKGHEYLIKAVPLLKKRFPSLRVLIVGEGRYRADLEKMAAELGFSGHVHFCGNVGDITEPMAAMDIFALPATWREGFGLSIIEAMACRKPVIVTNIWSLNSLIQDQVTGLMIPPKQAEPLAAAIAKLLEDTPFKEGIVERGYSLVKEQFSIERMAQEIQAVYQELITGKAGGKS